MMEARHKSAEDLSQGYGEERSIFLENSEITVVLFAVEILYKKHIVIWSLIENQLPITKEDISVTYSIYYNVTFKLATLQLKLPC